jgi:hypothetical protein
MNKYRNGHELAPGVSCNDRKFETWELKKFFQKDGKSWSQNVKVQVYAVPKDGYRGAEADGFKIVINGFAIVSRDLADLRRKAEAALCELTEANYEKVLVVKTNGYPRENEDAFGVEWQIGWRISKYGIVLDETRSYCLDVENYDEPDVSEEQDGFRIGSKPGCRGKQTNKTAVIPWTQEREDILRRTVTALGEMRDRLNEQLLRPDAFARMLDTGMAKHLLAANGDEARHG